MVNILVQSFLLTVSVASSEPGEAAALRSEAACMSRPWACWSCACRGKTVWVTLCVSTEDSSWFDANPILLTTIPT